jgi:hypothetical protein
LSSIHRDRRVSELTVPEAEMGDGLCERIAGKEGKGSELVSSLALIIQ